MEKHLNDLINESSPYLLQHAHNPVHWMPWSDQAFELAKSQNKMVLVSIGYSSCHWCHVMEHECFEDEEVAALMNKYFINIKVDREERPDVDQVYMTAVQLMTQKGGWPLNCFTLSDGRPIYGGTYFPKEQWMSILNSLHHAFTNEKDKVTEYAENLKKGIVSSELITKPAADIKFKLSDMEELILRWSKSFDSINGGQNRAPKFPLPNNYKFLLAYAQIRKDKSIIEHVKLSLDKMVMGGIYDQVGGGFSRYSVDVLWKVPHFEKMLYDNAQLISLYSKAYVEFKSPLYKRIVYQTIEWLQREMLSPQGGYYSALDADSEGVEGKFYIWKLDELKNTLQEDFDFVQDLYSMNERGFWEDGNYIPLRVKSDETIKKERNWSQEKLEAEIKRVNELLLRTRDQRIRPGLDDKSLTSWNAMLLEGFCDAYEVFGEDEFLFLANKCGKWIESFQSRKDIALWRTNKDGKSKISGFLEDYAHVISAFIALYKISGDDAFLEKALIKTEYAISEFFDENSGMFFFTASDSKLIARKMELSDNVIPSSNSVMAINLFNLGKYFNRIDLLNKSRQMLMNVYDGMELYGSSYSNWGILLNYFVFDFYEIVITGKGAKEVANNFRQKNIPNTLIAFSEGQSEIPLFDLKKMGDHVVIYVCSEGSCYEPVSSFEKALKLLQQDRSE